MLKAKIGLLVAAIAITTPAVAAPEGWRISEKSGTVTVLSSGVSKIALQGGAVAVGDVVSTGANGRAVLVRGQEYLVVAPGSRLRVADPAPSGGFVQIIQDVGNVIFKIKRKSTPHFAVQTPYLAAVVKGTTFSVTVGEAGASVQVIEGAVEVKTVDGGASDLVTPGMVAAVTARDMFTLKVDGDTSTVKTSPNAPSSSGDNATGSNGTASEPATQTASTTSSMAETEAQSSASAPAAATTAVSQVEARIEAPIVEASQPVAALTGGLIEGNATIVSPVRAAEVKTETTTPATTTAPVIVALATPPAPTVTTVAANSGDDRSGSDSANVDDDKADEKDTEKSSSGASGDSKSGTSGSGTNVAVTTTPPVSVDVAALPASGNNEDDVADEVAVATANKDSGTSDDKVKTVATVTSPPATVEVAALPATSGGDESAEAAAIAAEKAKADNKAKDVATVTTPPATVEVAALPATTTDESAATAETAKADGKAKDVAAVTTPPATVEVAALPATTTDESAATAETAKADGKAKDVATVTAPPATVEVAALPADTGGSTSSDVLADEKANGKVANDTGSTGGKTKDVAVDTTPPASVDVAALPATDTGSQDLASASVTAAPVDALPPASGDAEVASGPGIEKENGSAKGGLVGGRGKGAN